MKQDEQMKQHEHVNTSRERGVVTRARLLVATLLSLAACTSEPGNPGDAGDEEALVTVTIARPGRATPWWAPVERDGGRVNTVDVLLFDASDRFYHHTTGDTVIQLNARENFNVKLPAGEGFRMVVLANAGSLLAGKVPERGVTTRGELLDDLVMAPGEGERWEENALPMWGYRDNLSITPATTAVPGEIVLARAVARVNIRVTATVPFTLARAFLYNYNRAGTLAPRVVAGGTGYDASQWDGVKATSPRVPASVKQEGGFLEHAVTGSPAGLPGFYTFEAEAGTGGEITNTCLVLGGYYSGEGENMTVESFYRVEFRDGEGFLPLLRNHVHEVVIVEVNGPGYPTREAAYTAPPREIVATVTAENDDRRDETIIGDEPYLSCNKSLFEFSAAGGRDTLYIVTNFPDGWHVHADDAAALPAWLALSPTAGASNATGRVIIAAAANTTGTPREYTFRLVAGDYLARGITVRQSDSSLTL
jgi:hypothetical protein